MVLLVPIIVYAQSAAEKLAIIDHYYAEPRHYQLIIEKLAQYTTTSNEELISATISETQSKLELEFPGLTVYEVATGIKKATETFYDNDGGKKQELNEMTALYITMKQLENRGL